MMSSVLLRPLFSKPLVPLRSLCWFPINHNARNKLQLNKSMFTVVEADSFTMESLPDLDDMLPESENFIRRRNLRSICALPAGQEVNANELLIASVLRAREVLHASEDLAALLGCQPDEICHRDISVLLNPKLALNSQSLSP